MKRGLILKHEFVENIPGALQDGTIYVSVGYATAVHKCCCGCGNEIVTPFSPTDWQITFDGESISLNPSIGNWSFPCQSHYWVRHNKVSWAPRWSRKEIETGRTHDRWSKDRYFGDIDSATVEITEEGATGTRLEDSLWSKVKRWWRG